MLKFLFQFLVWKLYIESKVLIKAKKIFQLFWMTTVYSPVKLFKIFCILSLNANLI